MTSSPEVIRRARELLSQGYSPSRVLEHLTKEKLVSKDDTLSTRTISRWRTKPPRVASLIPKAKEIPSSESSVAEGNPIHAKHMAEVSQALLTGTWNYLDDIMENPGSTHWSTKYIDYQVGSGREMSQTDLYFKIKENWDIARRKDNLDPAAKKFITDDGTEYPLQIYSPVDYDQLISHLAAESRSVEVYGLDEAIRRDPYEVLEALRNLSRGKALKGECALCRKT